MKSPRVFFVLILLLQASCSYCARTSKVKTLGQCAADGWMGSTWAHCVAITEDGTTVDQDSPMVAGQEVCVEK